MKISPKAPTYHLSHSDSTYKSSLGKRTHMDSMTTKPPNSKNNSFKYKDHVKSLEIGTVPLKLHRRTNHHSC